MNKKTFNFINIIIGTFFIVWLIALIPTVNVTNLLIYFWLLSPTMAYIPIIFNCNEKNQPTKRNITFMSLSAAFMTIWVIITSNLVI